ncbi:hypothetical protein [Aliivibrio fischeri]|uniref:hypothetical protein n=1 Tax=Aliivibrio fischeri TaxID=668 RepID=UPI0007C4E2F2|nr:hypothetical protein [Aliivibrio fischeri]
MFSIKKDHQKSLAILALFFFLIFVYIYNEYNKNDSVSIYLDSPITFKENKSMIDTKEVILNNLSGDYYGITFFEINTDEGLITTNTIFKLKLRKAGMFELKGFFYDSPYILNGTWSQSKSQLVLHPIFGTGGELPITGQLYLFNLMGKNIQLKGQQGNVVYLFNLLTSEADLVESETDMFNLIRKHKIFGS